LTVIPLQVWRVKVVSMSRFLARQGSNGWFVYDRQRKGPALIGTDLAVDLTREQADKIQQSLNAELERQAPHVHVGSAE
jgi:hypothetical protein